MSRVNLESGVEGGRSESKGFRAFLTDAVLETGIFLTAEGGQADFLMDIGDAIPNEVHCQLGEVI